MYTIFLKRERKMFVICPKCSAKYQIPAEITLKNGQKVQCSACKHIFQFEKKEQLEQNESFSDTLKVPQDAILSETETIIERQKIEIETKLPEVFHPLKPMETQKKHSWFLTLLLAILLVVLIVFFCLYRENLFFQTKKNQVQTNRISDRNLPIRFEQNMIKLSDSVVEDTQKVEPIQNEIPLFYDNDTNKDSVGLKQNNARTSPFSFSSVHFRYQITPQEKQLLIEGKIHNDTDISQIMPRVIYAKAYDQKGNVLFQKEIYFSKELILPYGEKSFYSTYVPAPDGIQWMEVSCEK